MTTWRAMSGDEVAAAYPLSLGRDPRIVGSVPFSVRYGYTPVSAWAANRSNQAHGILWGEGW